MKTISVTLVGAGTILLLFGAQDVSLTSLSRSYVAPVESLDERVAWTPQTDQELIEDYCVRCHSDRRLRGNLSLETVDAAAPHVQGVGAEKMILKLRAGMMPPPGVSRPAGDSLMALAASLEQRVDDVAARDPNPGGRTFQRLNQVEYARSVRDLLGLEIDPSAFLPLDTKSANFDNIADAQMISATLLDSYLNAAASIARLAVGDPEAAASSSTYTNPGYASQWERVEGAPYGTRGGISVVHNFVADGEYEFRLAFEHTTTGGYFGGVTRGEQIEVSVDGERVALVEMDRWMSVADPNGVNTVSYTHLRAHET